MDADRSGLVSSTRILGPGDEQAVEAFLREHPDTTLFLRSNLALSGLGEGEGPYHGTWVCLLDGRRIVGVAAHFWNGFLILEAPVRTGDLAHAALAASRRPLHGIVGPWEQALLARDAAGYRDRPARLSSREPLYALPLADLVVPAALASGEWTVRAPRDDERELLVRWRVEYVRETKAQPDDAGLLDRAREGFDRSQREGRHWVLCREDRPVATSAFNAVLPEVVQVGGVWTPPPLRGRGYGRAVVAGTLRLARERGVARAVLFTPQDNVAAQRAYEALGFARVGDYGILGWD